MGLLRKVEKEFSRRGKRLEKDVQNLRDDIVEKALSASKEATKRSKNPKQLKPGLAVIFNNQNFENTSHTRKGSEKDVELLKKVFEKYSMTTLVVQDPSSDEIKNIIDKVISKIDFKNRSCIVITVLTHGSRFDTLAANDKCYSFYESILFPLFEPLKGIPKIIFTQACKGSTNLFLDRDSFEFPEIIEDPTGSPDEVFRFDSSFEGYVALRHRENGSFFINTLCQTLDQFGDDYSVQDIAVMVQKDLRDNEEIKNCQYPSINNQTLSEPFFFGDFKLEGNLTTPFTDSIDEFIALVN
ncbi:hypothetical protein ACFFRR_001754 [Megaselia abdita]